MGRKKLPAAFERARSTLAYQHLLAEHGIHRPDKFSTPDDVLGRAPVLSKASTFQRFGIHELARPGVPGRLAGVLTSSGRLGREFAFGVTTRPRAERAAADIDLGLELAFQVDSRRTLLINCLPMGVRFSSRAACVAEVSVREDMAAALAMKFGPSFDQVIFVVDPLFMKKLLDHGRDHGLDWRSLPRVHVVIGEEATGENFRDYVAARLGIDRPDAPDAPLIGSSFGVGELGLNLFFETRASIRAHRTVRAHPLLAQALFGDTAAAGAPPMLYAFNPLRHWVEVIDPDARGYGALAVSSLAQDEPLPLMRYRTGDIARLVDGRQVAGLCKLLGLAAPDDPFPWVAVRGRESEKLPDDSHVLDYKEALYADPAVADACTGAFKLHAGLPHGAAMEIQLRRGTPPPADASRFIAAACGRLRHEAVTWRPYEEFTHGMGLDYERKFDYFTAAS